MAQRCEHSGMLLGQCADSCCRPDLVRITQQIDRVVARFSARFDSDCDRCDRRMYEGDPICRTESGDYIHEHCSQPWDELTDGAS